LSELRLFIDDILLLCLYFEINAFVSQGALVCNSIAHFQPYDPHSRIYNPGNTYISIPKPTTTTKTKKSQNSQYQNGLYIIIHWHQITYV